MDWNSWVAGLIVALVPPVTALVVWAIRMLVPKIPRVALPILALALPWLLTLLVNYTTGHEFSPLVAALLGAAATWLRELINTLGEHKLGA